MIWMKTACGACPFCAMRHASLRVGEQPGRMGPDRPMARCAAVPDGSDHAVAQCATLNLGSRPDRLVLVRIDPGFEPGGSSGGRHGNCRGHGATLLSGLYGKLPNASTCTVAI
ncbi:hypothetical protein Veis_1561 [Verminephrobacter eiseniae EF01-2]|uniref:Uncharacterized protein n=1 Tax=Verminephrobacter eiseniae (strain EF01-2) TaxID=391735 RepID=A1WI63_VEREI|nr:hypothetical protein Veis_1561 [Verminephrobacter eiseniae EF01-2]